MAEMLGIRNTNFKNDKATTGSKKGSMPQDFQANWAKYAASDELLYEYAHARLDESLLGHEKCQISGSPVDATDVQKRLFKFEQFLQ